MFDIFLFSIAVLLMALQPLVGGMPSFGNNSHASDRTRAHQIGVPSDTIDFAKIFRKYFKILYKKIVDVSMIGNVIIILFCSYLLLDVTIINDCDKINSTICSKIPMLASTGSAALWQHWQSVIQLSIALSLGAIAILRLRDAQEQGISSLIEAISDRLSKQEERMGKIFVPTGYIDECLSQELSTDMIENGERNPEPTTPEELKRLIRSAKLEERGAKEMVEMSSYREIISYVLFVAMGFILSLALVYASWNPNKFMAVGAAFSLFIFLAMSAFAAPITIIIQFLLLLNARQRMMTIKSKSDKIEEVLRENAV